MSNKKKTVKTSNKENRDKAIETLVENFGSEVVATVAPKLDGRLKTEMVAKIKSLKRKTITEKEAEVKVLVELRQPIGIPSETPRAEVMTSARKQVSEYQKEVLSIIKKLGKGKEAKQLPLINSIVLRVTPKQAVEIAQHADVKKMRLITPEKVTCLNNSVPLIDVPKVWNLGYNGEGVKVAVIDTGIDKNHTALAGKVVYEKSFHPNEGVSQPGDHGTHCAGIIASGNSTYKGVAPNVKLLNIKVLDAAGYGEADYAIEGIQDAVEQGADIISMSVGWIHLQKPTGHAWECEDGNCPLCKAVDNAVMSGVIVVVAAGNEDNFAQPTHTPPYPAVDTHVRCPGNARGAITVGGTDKSDHNYTNTSIGPGCQSDQPKPEVCAPGVSIKSTLRNNGWGFMTGTSMSTPHVAGLCALMKQKDPELTCAEAKKYLKTTAINLGYNYNMQGAGRVDADAAMNAVTVYNVKEVSHIQVVDVSGKVIDRGFHDVNDAMEYSYNEMFRGKYNQLTIVQTINLKKQKLP
jgi:serine protease AprX